MRRELANRGEPRSEPDRRQEEKLPSDPARNYRSPAQRDRDRILYCSAFHRLAYVTQVTASEAGHTFHNRLGHSLKVAQVGRRNAERLERLAEDGELDEKAAALVASIDPDAVEASCLGHDLGHPPFGHIAERALHEEAQTRLGSTFDAFEGNAQSFRIVSRLAVRDLTYAVHDLDDFYRAGLIPLHRLRDGSSPESERLTGLFEEAKEAEPATFPTQPIDELVDATRRALAVEGLPTAYEYTVGNRVRMREFGSKLITRYLKAFRLVSGGGGVELEIDDEARCEVEALKLLVRVYVIRRPGLAVVQHGQERVIRELFCRYFDASASGENGDRRIFPPGARERLEKTDDSDEERARAVIDLIAGLTEAGAIQLHQRLEGGWVSARALDATAGAG